MRILITNNGLSDRAGSELYVRDVAIALLRRGHQPIAYSQVLGAVAEEIREVGVPVVDDLNRITEPPQIIHGHHHLETVTALSQFPGVPAIFFCHGWLPWQEAPPLHPRIRRYVAVDELCRQRLVHEAGVGPNLVEVILNFVDLERFQPRPALPATPGRALFLSNHGVARALDALKQGCADAGVELGVVGAFVGNQEASPETMLREYDVVFAKGRAALEAMAVGCAAVICGRSRLGPPVTVANFDELRPVNFGHKAVEGFLTPERVKASLAGFDPRDAGAVSDRVRREAGMEHVVDRLIQLYKELIDIQPCPKEDEGRAVADYLRSLAPTGKERDLFNLKLAESEKNRFLLEERLPGLETEVEGLRGELDAAYGTRTWRLRERILRTRFGRWLQRLWSR